VRIAIVGTGVSGLTCAHLLARDHDVTLFEASDRLGGHSYTVMADDQGVAVPIDIGFIVYNERNYPLFSRLLSELGVATQPSEMSFSVVDHDESLEWRGSGPRSIFAQPRNLVRPKFLRMLADVTRFNRAAQALLEKEDDVTFTLGDFIKEHSWSRGFLEWYLIPMGSAIWSSDPSVFTEFPACAFARFFSNHGLLGLGDRPQWRTIVGGSAAYVRAITDPLGDRVRRGVGVTKIVRRGSSLDVATEQGDTDSFDHVILATHSDETLELLADPSDLEREILGHIPYRTNVATLHRDARLLPHRRRARASWNWQQRRGQRAPTLTYDLSRLQGLPGARPWCLTLNQPEAVDPTLVYQEITFRHPVYNPASMAAQRRHDEISGVSGVSYAGAYWGYGFHEDGVKSAVKVARSLGSTWGEETS